jgi:hypothetical protein
LLIGSARFNGDRFRPRDESTATHTRFSASRALPLHP